MGVPRPTRDTRDLPDTSAPPPNDAPTDDVRDLPRNEAFRHGASAAPADDPTLGETRTQDVEPTADDIQLEATLLRQRPGRAGVDEWRQAERRLAPGLEAERDEASPVRGPSADAGTGRVITEGETVADDRADADATGRNAARTDDPDGV